MRTSLTQHHFSFSKFHVQSVPTLPRGAIVAPRYSGDFRRRGYVPTARFLSGRNTRAHRKGREVTFPLTHTLGVVLFRDRARLIEPLRAGHCASYATKAQPYSRMHAPPAWGPALGKTDQATGAHTPCKNPRTWVRPGAPRQARLPCAPYPGQTKRVHAAALATNLGETVVRMSSAQGEERQSSSASPTWRGAGSPESQRLHVPWVGGRHSRGPTRGARL